MEGNNKERNSRVKPEEKLVKVEKNPSLPRTANTNEETKKRKKIIDECEIAIKWHKRHKEIMKKQFDLVQESPIRIPEKREHMYENNPLWEETAREMNAHLFLQKLNEKDFDVSGLQDRINMLRKMDFEGEKEYGIQKKEEDSTSTSS